VSEDEALAGYRAAVAFISADSWDGCSDCIEVLKAARAADWNNEMAGNSDAVAEHLKRIRKHYTNPVEAGLTAQSAELEALRGEVEETAEIAEQDGYSKAVQDIDVRTGGDGEYYASMMPGRGCETPQAMMANIVERFSEKEATISQLRARNAALEEGLGGIRDGIILIRMLFELEEECDNRAAELTRHINALLNQNGEA